uniref:Uncharacterized protein n=1 Tax=Anguilla anguilla TaxID=7936 RepID=A0A0E9SM33_ANGAN
MRLGVVFCVFIQLHGTPRPGVMFIIPRTEANHFGIKNFIKKTQ